AIIGPQRSSKLQEVANNVTITDKVLLLGPSSTSPAISDIDDNGLIWRVAPPDTTQAEALAKVLNELEAQLSPPIRVAIVYQDDAYGVAMNAKFQNFLSFNGKPALQNGGNFATTKFSNINDSQDPGALAALAALNPHVVIFAAGGGRVA